MRTAVSSGHTVSQINTFAPKAFQISFPPIIIGGSGAISRSVIVVIVVIVVVGVGAGGGAGGGGGEISVSARKEVVAREPTRSNDAVNLSITLSNASNASSCLSTLLKQVSENMYFSFAFF